jgi:hypothetical protein
LFRIDLSAVVSKYIGETEEFAPRVRRSGGRRRDPCSSTKPMRFSGSAAEVKTADRYANVEISYLLQRMERIAAWPSWRPT